MSFLQSYGSCKELMLEVYQSIYIHIDQMNPRIFDTEGKKNTNFRHLHQICIEFRHRLLQVNHADS